MLTNPDYVQARELLLNYILPVTTEVIPLSQCGGRILGMNLVADKNIPDFERSPYDGFAFCSADTCHASKDNPVTLRILEEIPAGSVPTRSVTSGTAAKVLTGAPIPEGADAVIMHEKTSFTTEHVTISNYVKQGANIVRVGEDVLKGTVLAKQGDIIDPGLTGTLAAQGVLTPTVHKKPRVGILSTGNELVYDGVVPEPGKIRNSNGHMLATAIKNIGCEPVYLGIAHDSVEEIAALIQKGLCECDAVITTGGVSAGDYDLTPIAMGSAGVTLLIRGVNIKPGMACVYGTRSGKLVCGLSGNPASSLTNFYAVALPALKKLTGRWDFMPAKTRVTLLNDFHKRSPVTRFLRGHLVFNDGTICMALSKDQGNVVLSSTIGCNIMAVIPAGSDSICAGTVLEGFLI